MFTTLVSALRFVALVAALVVGNVAQHLNAAAPEFTPETLVRGLATPWAIDFAPWAGSLLFTGLHGQTLYRVVLDPSDPNKARTLERDFFRRFGRLRDVVEGPDKALYFSPAITTAEAARQPMMTASSGCCSSDESMARTAMVGFT